MRIYHDSSNSYIEQSTGATGDLIIQQKVDDKDIIFKSDDGSGGLAAYLTLDGTNVRTKFHKTVNLEDDVQLQIGNSQDLKLYHNGSHSYIAQAGVGNLYIQNEVDDGDIVFISDDGSGGVETYFFLDGSAKGASPLTVFPDHSQLSFGSGPDTYVYHNGSDFYAANYTGDFYIDNNADDKDVILRSDDGSGGVTAYITLDGSVTRTIFNKHTQIVDGQAYYVGTGTDGGFYASSDNVFLEAMNGDMTIVNYANDKDIIFQSDDGSGGVTAYITLDGSESNISIVKHTVHPDDIYTAWGNANDFYVKHNVFAACHQWVQ